MTISAFAGRIPCGFENLAWYGKYNSVGIFNQTPQIEPILKTVETHIENFEQALRSKIPKRSAGLRLRIFDEDACRPLCQEMGPRKMTIQSHFLSEEC